MDGDLNDQWLVGEEMVGWLATNQCTENIPPFAKATSLSFQGSNPLETEKQETEMVGAPTNQPSPTPRRVATWRKHKCDSTHRTTRTWIQCAIGKRRVLWIVGTGDYASISWCGNWDHVTVVLHRAAQDASAAADFIDRIGCGGRCTGSHQVIEVKR